MGWLWKKQNGGHELGVPQNSNISAANCLSVKIPTARHTFSMTPNPMGPWSTSPDITGIQKWKNSPFPGGKMIGVVIS